MEIMFILGPQAERNVQCRNARFTDTMPKVQGKPLYFFFSGVGLKSPGTAVTSGLLYSPK
jgi:hypothetical protein